MPAHKPMRDSLRWAKQSRDKWRAAYDRAVEDKHTPDADFATRQIVALDRMIARYERFLANAAISAR